MKLLSIRLNNVRRFTQPVEITGFGAGLNVLSAPNESGKSTIFDALHALFFFDAKSWKQKEAASLAPHAGGNPEISADIEVDGQRFRLHKTFMKGSGKGEVTIHRNGHLFKQADAAEAWIRDLIQAPKDGGPAGLIWVRQGLTTLHADKDDDTYTARRGLLSSVAGEIEDVTGGRQMEQIRAEVASELARYLTKTGKPFAHGPLAAAQQAVATLSERQTRLADQERELRDKLATRRALVRERALLKDPESVRQQADNLHTAEQALELAKSHAAKQNTAQARADAAAQSVETNQTAAEALTHRISEHEAASAELSQAQTALDTLTERLATASREQDKVEAQATDAAQTLASRRKTFDAVLQTETRRHDVARRKELVARRADAQKMTEQSAKTKMEIASAPSRTVMATLEDCWRDLQLLERAHNAAAAAITLTREAGQSGRVTLNDAPMQAGVRMALPDGGEIRIDGVGTIRVHAAELNDADQLNAARARFAAALNAAGHDTLADARAAARQRDAAQEVLDRCQSQLKVLAPDGIDALIAEIATLPEQDAADQDLPDRADAQTALEAAQSAHDAARARLVAAQAIQSRIHGEVLVSQEARENARSRLDRAAAAIENIDVAREKLRKLAARGTDLEQELMDAHNAVVAISANAPDLALAEAGATRARDVVTRARARQQEIDNDLARLEAQIEHEADLGIEEQLAETRGRLELAQKHEADITRELAVLQRLDAALANAQADAHDAYIQPILQELRPLLRMVLPGADLKLDAETVLPTGLIRPEGEDSFEQLSGGTKEQIALLVRLAFARLLAKSGTPAPVILDDAIVYTDDDRIERMFDALTNQAADLQIIVLSCRQKVFRGLGGQTLRVNPAVPRDVA